MAYVKQVWTDRQVERPLTFVITENVDGTSTLIPSPGTVTQDGTLITADRMNHIEEGIAGLDSNITVLEGAIETANSNINTINNNINNINKNLDTKKSKGDFVVLTGTIKLTNGEGEAQMSYPTGFNKDNCVVVSASVEINTGNPNTENIFTKLTASVIIIRSKYQDGPSATRNYKLVLMKIN